MVHANLLLKNTRRKRSTYGTIQMSSNRNATKLKTKYQVLCDCSLPIVELKGNKLRISQYSLVATAKEGCCLDETNLKKSRYKTLCSF